MTAIDFLDEEPLSAPRDVSPGLENKVQIPIPPPVASSSRREGLSTSGVPLDSIPHDTACIKGYFEVKKCIKNGIKSTKFISIFCEIGRASCRERV